MKRQVFDTPLPHCRATMTRRSLRSLVASSRRMSELIFASIDPLKICAAMMLAFAFAADGASAQTPCPQGQTRISSTAPGSEFNTGCFADADFAIVNACRNAGWGDGTVSGLISFFTGELGCEIPSFLYGDMTEVNRGAQFCFVRGNLPLCTDIYGSPPVFPKAADHPTVKPEGGDRFVANCDQGGSIPGGYPPDQNLKGATECSCDLNSHVGTWPNCTAFPTGLTPAEREGIRTCADQGWTISTATAFFRCNIPLISGETEFEWCVFGSGSPQCADVFGAAELAFPEKEDSVRYVFDCGAGMSPQGANLNGATECAANLRLRLRLFLEGPLR